MISDLFESILPTVSFWFIINIILGNFNIGLLIDCPYRLNLFMNSNISRLFDNLWIMHIVLQIFKEIIEWTMRDFG